MDNQSNISIKFQNGVTGEKKLEKYAETLQKVNSLLNGIDSGKIKSLETASNGITKVNKSLDGATNGANNFSKALNGALQVGKIGLLVKSVSKLVGVMSKFIDKSASYYENLNLMEVAYHGNTREAMKFVNTLTEMYGLDDNWLISTTSYFKQMANAMGLSDELGSSLAETLTQLSIDTASLYNYEPDETVAMLKSTLAGQTKPARRLGGDITQGTLQNFLDANGIDKAVSELSYAEKRLVIVSALLNQTSEAGGDWGRTIESVANQTRIFHQQTEKISRALGDLFMPIVAQLLPYLNALAMVLYEVISAMATFIAELFGYDGKDAISQNQDIPDWFDDIENKSKKANDSVKKLKQGLRGFDKLNNIKTPSSGSTGGGSTGGNNDIDKRIKDLYSKYNENYQKKLENVKMKATEIRDKIMDWLGFTKYTDEETGKVYFKFEKLTGGTMLGALGVGGFIYLGVKKIGSILTKLGLNPFTGLTKAFGYIGKFATASGLTEAFSDIGIAISGWVQGAWSFTDALELISPALGTIGTVILGIGAVLVGVQRTISGINKILEGDTFKGILRVVEGIALVVAGIAVVMGGWIVALVAGVVALVALIIEYWDEIKATIIDPIVAWFDSIIQKTADFFEPLFKFINQVIELIVKVGKWVYTYIMQPLIHYASAIIEIIVTIFNNIWERITTVIEGIVLIVKKVIEIGAKIIEIIMALYKAIYNYIIQPVLEIVGKLFGIIYDKIIKPLIDLFVNIGKWVYDKIVKPILDGVTWLKNQAIDLFKNIGLTVVNFISGIFKSVVNGIFEKIEKNINGFIKLLNKAIKIINKIPEVNIKTVDEIKLPRLKTGIDFVPNDYYPAYLDYGERVLTKEQNKAYTNAINGNGTIGGTPINATFIVQVGDEVVATKVLNDLQDMARSNGKPIKIS